MPEGHTLWDHILVPGARTMSLDSLFAWFAAQLRLKVTEVLVKNKCIFSTLNSKFSKNDANRPRKLTELIEELDPGKTSKPFYKLDQIVFHTFEGDDVKAATIVLQLA